MTCRNIRNRRFYTGEEKLPHNVTDMEIKFLKWCGGKYDW